MSDGDWWTYPPGARLADAVMLLYYPPLSTTPLVFSLGSIVDGAHRKIGLPDPPGLFLRPKPGLPVMATTEGEYIVPHEMLPERLEARRVVARAVIVVPRSGGARPRLAWLRGAWGWLLRRLRGEPVKWAAHGTGRSCSCGCGWCQMEVLCGPGGPPDHGASQDVSNYG